MEQLQALIDAYIAWARECQKTENKLQAYLGMGKIQPNHNAFYEAVGSWAQSYRSAQRPSEDTMAALRLLLFTAAEQRGTRAEWYLIAIQRHARDLIADLTSEEKARLAQEYRKRYPRSTRLPVQNEINRLLSGRK